jgi:single-strand DNA-binding protein
MSINKVILVGNVGKDPDVRYLESRVPVCTIPIATNETYTKNGERIKNTEWHNVVLWRKLAEVAEKYVKKGDLLYIEGKIRSRNYEDKEGNKRFVTEIVADSMQMLGKRSEGNDTVSDSNNAVSAKETVETYDDPAFITPAGDEASDLPF